MDEILNIRTPVAFDDSISHYEIHAHQPYAGAHFNNNDEIRILIQHQDLYLLPSRSTLRICGRLINSDNTRLEHTKFVNNGLCHLFDEIRYEINAIEIDRSKNVGITTLMKGWTSFNPRQNMENAGWTDIEETKNIVNDNGYFDVFIPLNMILGFAEDYKKILINTKHELILRRSNTDLNAVLLESYNSGNPPTATWESWKIDLTKIEWLMPYVFLSNESRIRMLNHMQKGKPVAMSFRSWELFEYPALPTTSKHVWTVKTSNQLEKPRFIILGFQTDRKNKKDVNASLFDHCDISNVKLFLNSQYYPYGNLNLNIDQNQYSILYDMFVNFQSSYYGKDAEPILNRDQFIKKMPLIILDCSKQNESLKNAPVDVRLEIETRQNFPANTSAYCLIIHDRIVEYNPMSGDVRKIA